MLERLFTALTRAIEGEPAVALAAAFVWGILSILLSPCHLASIPLIVGFIGEQERITTRRAFQIALLFALGILITIGVIGALTAAAGRMLGDVGSCGNYFVAVVFFLVGLHLLGVIPLPFTGPGQVALKRRGRIAALILGLVFGIALGPCTFAYLAPMLAVTFRMASAHLTYGILLLLAYGFGHCLVIVLAGKPRIVNGTVDIGAYEAQVDSDDDGIPDTYEWRHTRTLTGMTPGGDLDGDSSPNFDEYVSDTDPTNKQSVLTLEGISCANGIVRVDWRGGQAARQYLERRTGVGPGPGEWAFIFTNEPPTPEHTDTLDTRSMGNAVMYRIKAERP